MIADLRPYSAYKETEVLWVGDVPEHWEVLPNRALFVELKERNHPDEEMLSVTITKGIIRQKALLEGSSKKDGSNLNKSAYKLVCPRDLAYNKMRAWQGSIGISDFRGIVSPAYVVMRLRDDNIPRYFHHLYRTPHFAKEAERWSYGITSDMWSLRPEHFRMIYSPLPPQDEQTAIVRFLDHTNRRIEKAIRAKRKLIALLNEQKRVIIHRAVTRGLDQNARLKPSGIPWIGDIPEPWESISVGAGSVLIQTGPFGSQLHSYEYIQGGIPLINPSHLCDGQINADLSVTVSEFKMKELARHRLCLGDIVAARRGELGRCAVVTSKEEGWLCGTGSMLIRCKPSVFAPSYFQQVFSSQGVHDSLRLTSIGATMDNLNTGMVARLRVPLPPIEEQLSILGLVEDQRRQHEKAMGIVAHEITLLREYRTRLIADVVIGKLDVREAAKQLPDEAGEPEAPIDGNDLADETEFEPALIKEAV